MSALKVDVLADLQRLANVGEYRELRDAMEKSLRPHEREGFADLLGRMPATLNAVAELIEVATTTKNALAIIAGSEESDTSDKYYQLLFEDLPNLRAALALVGGAK